YSPSGVILNRGYPFVKVEGERTDHPHHIGMYFTVDIEEEKFWGNSRDPLPAIKHIKTTKMKGGVGKGTLSTLMYWVGMDGKVLLEENREMIFSAVEGQAQYAIDFTIILKAVTKEVVFVDNKEGMFAVRVAHWLNERGTGRYLSSNGEETEKNVWGKRAKWMRLEGRKAGKKYGIAIFQHPRSVNYPTYWHARGYGCFTANPLGQYVFQKARKVKNPQPLNLTLKKGESSLFKFRMLIYEGPQGKEQLDKEFENYGATASVVAPGGKVRKLAGGFKFTEGPAADARGNVYFTDVPNNRIHKWSTDGRLTTFRENSGGANGLFFDKDGNLLVCEGDNRRIVSIDTQGSVKILADKYNNRRFNKPNDLWADPKGGIYFSDPVYGQVEKGQDGGHVYYLTPDRKKVIRVIDDYVWPNGMIGTPDGKTLYVTDPGDKKTYVYTVNSDGTLSNKRLFAPEGSDGMTIDTEGNIYLTTRVVVVYDRDGNKIETIDTPEKPSNVCFGGKDNQMLFITARKSLYAVPMRVRGVGRMTGQSGMNIPTDYQLVYSQSFDEAGSLDDFEFADAAKWEFSEQGKSGGALEFLGPGKYKPKVRSPRVLGLLSGKLFGDFILEADLFQTGKEYGHRDMCMFLNFQDPSEFYYVHIATRADPHAHNIFIVNNQPRTAIAKKTTKGIDWGKQVWHRVRLERDTSAGTIIVYFDDMNNPLMIAEDKSFRLGRIGFGSFDDTGKIDNVKIWAPRVVKSEKIFFEKK
ncbi:MAG: PmoA family protein, partial [Sedimentisphaerales bacterium]|nr:PmoA family protein [Sedimentisphaerales bacterium]